MNRLYIYTLLHAKTFIIIIERSFGLRRAERHKNDATGVDVLVQDMVKRDTNPVLLYKPQDQDTTQDCPSLV